MVYGGGGETGGREGLRLASLVALTKAEGVSLLPRRDKLSGCTGETPSGLGSLERLGEFQVGVAAPCKLGELSRSFSSPPPRAFFFSFSVFVLAGKIGNYIVVNATLNRKRKGFSLKKKKRKEKVNCLFVLA